MLSITASSPLPATSTDHCARDRTALQSAHQARMRAQLQQDQWGGAPPIVYVAEAAGKTLALPAASVLVSGGAAAVSAVCAGGSAVFLGVAGLEALHGRLGAAVDAAGTSAGLAGLAVGTAALSAVSAAALPVANTLACWLAPIFFLQASRDYFLNAQQTTRRAENIQALDKTIATLQERVARACPTDATPSEV